MSKLMQFIFAAYAPMVARFHLVEPTGFSATGKEPVRPASEASNCATLPGRRTTAPRSVKKPRKSMAA